jgi:hypothetical protein
MVLGMAMPIATFQTCDILMIILLDILKYAAIQFAFMNGTDVDCKQFNHNTNTTMSLTDILV